MDPITQQQTIQTTVNPLANDLHVSTQVDPSQLSKAQVTDDLSALLDAEKQLTESPKSTSLNTPKPKPSVFNSNLPQELQALQLKNPFKGE
jgi:hypothetical protein